MRTLGGLWAPPEEGILEIGYIICLKNISLNVRRKGVEEE